MVRSATETSADMAATPFHDLDEFLALPRVGGLAVSRDGSRVVTTIAASR